MNITDTAALADWTAIHTAWIALDTGNTDLPHEIAEPLARILADYDGRVQDIEQRRQSARSRFMPEDHPFHPGHGPLHDEWVRLSRAVLARRTVTA